MCLVVSGGHTMLVYVKDYCDMEILGGTRDDAAGECFDKIARVLGMPYPGGAALDRLSQSGDETKYRLPRAHVDGNPLDLSFSGLKTAAINLIHNARQKGEEIDVPSLCASVSAAVSEALTSRTELALTQFRETAYARQDASLPVGRVACARQDARHPVAAHSVRHDPCSAENPPADPPACLPCREAAGEGPQCAHRGGEPPLRLAVAGGVAANSRIRRDLTALCGRLGVELYLPELRFCGDNGAMIGAQAYYEYLAGHTADQTLNAYATKSLLGEAL